MATGTFTIVDEITFYPSNKLQDVLHEKSDESNSLKQSDDDDSSSDDTDSEGSQKSADVNKETGHRKEVRRKSDEDIPTPLECDVVNIEKNIICEFNNQGESSNTGENSHKIKKKKKRKKSKYAELDNDNDNDDVHVKMETHNQFEFCGTIDDEAEIKQEILSSDENNLEQKDDICNFDKKEMSSEESDDDVPLAALDKFNVNKQEKRSCDDSDTDTKKVKKIKITKMNDSLKVECNSDVHFCAKCNKFCKNKKKYRSHIRKVHGKLYKCIYCTCSYDTQEALDDHCNLHTGNRPYSCYLCDNVTLKTEHALKDHMKKYHSGKPLIEKRQYHCDICGKVLLSSTTLDEHLRIHRGEKPSTCTVCNKTFTRDSDLKQHQNVHDEIWKCKICSKCFPTPYKLKEHARKHTGELPYECDKCDRRFARAGDFRYHVGTHLGLKPYTCEECGMRFTTSSNVTRHRLNTHQEGPRELACPQCPKLFHTENRLNAHIKNHENKNKFKCELCSVTRNSLAELTKHALIHSGEFRCDTCHRGFMSAERLASHAARHDIAGKPYACFVCSIGYRSSQSLNKHLSTVHRNEDIPKIAPQHLCTLCGQVFEMKDKLNRHLKESHIVIVVGEIHSIDEDVDTNISSIKKSEEIDDKKDVKVNVFDTKKSIDVLPTIAEKKPESNPTSELRNLLTNGKQMVPNPMSLNKNIKTAEVPEISKHLSDLCNFTKPQNNVINIPNPAEKIIHPFQDKAVGPMDPIPTDNSIAKDLSASSVNTEIKSVKNNVRMPYKPFEENNYVHSLPYSDMLVQQTNRLLHPNYRPPFDNYPQEHVNNTWFLPKSNDITPAHKALIEARQRYNELRMPRLDQTANYRNFNHVNPARLETPHLNHNIPPQIPSNDRKYYYDNANMIADRSKYAQHDTSISRQRDYQNHQNYAQSPRDLSNSGQSDSQSPHYLQHAFPSPHFFPNFRDLQQRMLGGVDYGHPRHLPVLTGMDMTNQRLNPVSPSYNLDNMSPMSRNSYEEASNHHVPPYHGNHLQNRLRNNVEPLPNSNVKDAGNGDQMGGAGPYEMKVAAN